MSARIRTAIPESVTAVLMMAAPALRCNFHPNGSDNSQTWRVPRKSDASFQGVPTPH